MTAIQHVRLCHTLALVMCLCSCTRGQMRETDTDDEDTLWMADPAIVSDVEEAETQVSEPADPEREVLSFNDFFFLFIRNKSFQARHIKFPVDIEELDKTSRTITSGAAFREYFNWPGTEEYTLLLTDVAEMERLQGEMQLDSVGAEVIDLEEMTMRSYEFLSRDSVWRLHRIRNDEPQGRVGDFLRFYAQFASDTIFQEERLAESIRFSSSSPDDETELIEGILLPSQWPTFRPELPQGIITNFSFGQPLEDSPRIILLQCGVASSMIQTCTFEQQHGRWLLSSFEN